MSVPGSLETLPLGGSGLRVTRLGLGTAPLGNLVTEVQEPDADATIDAALGAGVTFVDTAPHYGLGVAERRLGRRLAQVPRDRFVLSTKVGRLVRPLEAGEMADPEGFVATPAAKRVWDLSRDGVRWRRAWSGSAWTGSTWPWSTTPTTTSARPPSRPSPRWPSSATKEWSGPSGPA